ncbi:MAG: hypothetical protein JJE13_11730 [Thermoleophilia bacterium]|nr:hypothetical protein [Thermoleophilia bacterium]
MITIATLVNWDQLLESVAAGAISAIVLTIVVSFGIRGTAKYVDYSQDNRMGLAYASLAVGGISVILTAALIILGIYLMING